MKKKLFNVTVGGYYMASVVLGMLMMLAMSVVMELSLTDWAFSEGDLYGSRLETYDLLWEHLPLTICDWLWGIGPRYIAGKVIGIVTAFLSVWLVVTISLSKNWRTKVLQATSWCILGLLATSAIRSVLYTDIANISWLLAVVLLAIPMVILGKTRMPKNEAAGK